MTIYPDNNIIVSLEKSEFDITHIESILGTNNLDFYFSDAHLFETHTMTSYGSFTKEELVALRLSTIQTLTNGKYIDDDEGVLRFSIVDPATEYGRRLIDYPSRLHIAEGFQKNMTFEDRKRYRELLKIDTNRLNSLKHEDVVPYLNSCYISAGCDTDFTGTVRTTLEQLESSDTGELLYNKCAVLFGLLDTVGYARDKETERSDFARMWDSRHVAFAASLEVFLTMDVRTIRKATLVYELLGISTKVVRMLL